MTYDKEKEEAVMTMISCSGQARSLAIEALRRAKERDFGSAEELLAQSQKMSLAAHDIQTGMLRDSMQGKSIEVDLLLVHAQDHLMCATLAQDLIQELIELRRHDS